MITYFAAWQRDFFIYYVSGITTFILAANWMDVYPGVTVAVWFLAAYQVYKGTQMILQSSGPSKGWSQIKALFRKGGNE
ncbi:hypothetical protein ES703_20770 [subsurface metagenome]